MRKTLIAYIGMALCLAGIFQPAGAAKIAAPDDLIVVGSGSGKLALYWYKVQGAKSYLIYRNTPARRKQKKPSVLIARLVKAEDSYMGSPMKLWVDRKVSNGHEYLYSVKAVDSRGKHSVASIEVSEFANPDTPPWASRNARSIIQSTMGSSSPIRGKDSITVSGPDGYIYEKTPKGGYKGHKPELIDFALPTA